MCGNCKTLVEIQYVFLHLNFLHILPNLCDRFNEWYLLALVADTKPPVYKYQWSG